MEHDRGSGPGAGHSDGERGGRESGRGRGRSGLRRRLLLAISLPVVGIGLLLLALLAQVGAIEDGQVQARDARRVATVVRQVQSLVIEMETGVRGYHITEDRAYLSGFEAAGEALPPLLEQLDAVDGIMLDPAAGAALRTVVEERVAVAERAAALDPSSTPRDEVAALLAEGRALSDELRDRAGGIIEAESDRTDAALDDIERGEARVRLVAALALVLALVGGVMSWRSLTDALRRIERLSAGAGRLERGQLVEVPDDGRRDEISALGHALAYAGATIEANRRSLEDQLAAQRDLAVALEESQTLLQAILDNSPVAIYLKDPDGTITLANQACAELFGRPPDEVVGSTIRRLLPGWADQHEANDALVRREGVPRQFEESLRRDGVGRTYLSTRFLIDRGDDSPPALATISTDITLRTQAEDEMRAARAVADQASAAKSEFLSRMSHELRTPLNSLLGFAQLIGMDDLAPEHREAVDYILRAGRHLLDLINEVLDIARIEAGRMTVSIEPVLAIEVVDQAVDLIRPLAEERSIVPQVRGGEGLHLRADRQRLLQVLLNLLANGVKYNRHGGVLVADVGADDDTVSIAITDTGPGLTPAQIDRLFQPFDRLGAEQTSIEGTGVGLTLSARLVELMGGHIEVASEVAQGTTFTVRFPRVEPVDGPEDQRRPVADDAEQSPVAHGLRVLYVEDNLANMALVERVLRRRPGTELIPAMQGRLALDLALQHRPDVVLLDLHLPDGSGADVLAALRTHPATATTPVIIVSADATPGQIRRLTEAGAARYLTKPLDVHELLLAIDDVTGNGR